MRAWAATARRRVQGRRSMALVVALAFVVGFLGLAALVVQMTTADHLDSVALTNHTQVELSSAAAMEAGAAAVNARTGTPAQIEAWAATRSAADPAGDSLGRSCYEWWLESFDAEAGSTRLRARAWAPGQLTGAGCATPPNARVPVGVAISAQLERTDGGRWAITERTVAPIAAGD